MIVSNFCTLVGWFGNKWFNYKYNKTLQQKCVE